MTTAEMSTPTIATREGVIIAQGRHLTIPDSSPAPQSTLPAHLVEEVMTGRITLRRARMIAGIR